MITKVNLERLRGIATDLAVDLSPEEANSIAEELEDFGWQLRDEADEAAWEAEDGEV